MREHRERKWRIYIYIKGKVRERRVSHEDLGDFSLSLIKNGERAAYGFWLYFVCRAYAGQHR